MACNQYLRNVDQAAIALCDAALADRQARVRIDVARGSPRLQAHVQRLGLADLGYGPLMTWPDARLPGERARYHALALQAFG